MPIFRWDSLIQSIVFLFTLPFLLSINVIIDNGSVFWWQTFELWLSIKPHGLCVCICVLCVVYIKWIKSLYCSRCIQNSATQWDLHRVFESVIAHFSMVYFMFKIIRIEFFLLVIINSHHLWWNIYTTLAPKTYFKFFFFFVRHSIDFVYQLMSFNWKSQHNIETMGRQRKWDSVNVLLFSFI